MKGYIMNTFWIIVLSIIAIPVTIILWYIYSVVQMFAWSTVLTYLINKNKEQNGEKEKK